MSVRESARPRPEVGELTLLTGRLLEHYQSGAQTRRVPELDEAQPEALASMHPSTAERLGIADGELVELANGRGTVRCRARLTADIRPDSVFLPFHYGDEQTANLLASDAVDPISSMPEFKTNVVRVTALAGSRSPRMSPALRIVLVGYGPVGARFVEELLPAVREGSVELTVVAGEDIEAYNRVLVAEYAVGNTDLESMIVGDRDAAEAAGARVLLGVAATSVDRAARTVQLSSGEELGYDRLVLATGSVPTCRPSTASSGTGATSLRSRSTRGTSWLATMSCPTGSPRCATSPTPSACSRRCAPASASSCSGQGCSASNSRSPRPTPARRCASCTTAPTRCRATSIAGAGTCCAPHSGARASPSSRTAARNLGYRTDDASSRFDISSPPTANSCAATCSCSRAA